MRGRASLIGLMLLGAACVGGCGGGDGGRALPDPGPDAGLDPSTPLSGLTPAGEAQLCEWVAGRLGGYDRRVTCSDGDYLVSEPSCVNTTIPACSDTVGDIESCVNDLVGGCTAFPPICVTLLLDCGMPMPNAHGAISEAAVPLFEGGRGVTRAAETAPAR